VAFWLGWWALCFGLWLLLVFKTEAAELAAGAVAAAFGATAVELVRALGYAPFSGSLRWARALRRLPREVTVDTWLVTRALCRQLARRERIQGRFRVVHLPGCSGDDPRSEARRATVKWLGSVSPNHYVIGVDEGRELVLLRQLAHTEEPPDLDPGPP
jgi:hypothetical protein